MGKNTSIIKNIFLPKSSLARGYSLVFYYLFDNYPRVYTLRAHYIARYHGRDDHYTKTIIGWALEDMVRRGFLEEHGKRKYRVREALETVLEACGFRCAFKRVCRLKGTNTCPFRIGEVWEP